MTFKPLLTALLFVLVATSAATAQRSPYSAAITVNGSAITYYEIEQRIAMMTAFGTAGDLPSEARKTLLEDRLKLIAAKKYGVNVLPDEMKAAIDDYAQRANMTQVQLLTSLQEQGVAPETFRDFLQTGLLWRKVIQGLFQAKATVSEIELDAAMALSTTRLPDAVRLAEIIIPLQEGREAEAISLAQSISLNVASREAFADAAKRFSASPSRDNGGLLDWVPIDNLPPPVAAQVLALERGEVSEPIRLPNAIIIFQMLGIRKNQALVPRTTSIDYARLLIPGAETGAAQAAAAKLVTQIDNCIDLEGRSSAYPEENFLRETRGIRNVPNGYGLELAKLDLNETSSFLTQKAANGSYLVFLMVCGRTTQISAKGRDEMRQTLFGERMESFGNGYLEELKGDAIIIRK